MQELVLDDVYGVWTTSFWHTIAGRTLIVTAVLGGILGLYGLVKIIGHWRTQSTKDRALSTLEALAKNVEKTSAKKAYRVLTDTIKMYMQWRYSMARGLTDYEVTIALSNVLTDKNIENELKRVIADAQAVKFGLADVRKVQMKDDIGHVISFIKITEKENQ